MDHIGMTRHYGDPFLVGFCREQKGVRLSVKTCWMQYYIQHAFSADRVIITNIVVRTVIVRDQFLLLRFNAHFPHGYQSSLLFPYSSQISTFSPKISKLSSFTLSSHSIFSSISSSSDDSLKFSFLYSYVLFLLGLHNCNSFLSFFYLLYI